MISRIIAVVAALGLVALTVVLALPAIRGVDPPVVTSGDPTRPVAVMERRTSYGVLEAEVFLLPDLKYRLDIRVSLDPSASPPRIVRPRVILEMAKMDMGRVEPPLLLSGMGEFQAEGALSMPGEWRFRLGFEDELFDLLVNVPESVGRPEPITSPEPITNPEPITSPGPSAFGHLLDHLGAGWL